MDLELLTQESEKTQKEQLERAKESVTTGLANLDYHQFKTGIALFQKFAKPAFTADKQLDLEQSFFDQLESELKKLGIVRNEKKLLMPNEHPMRHPDIVFSLEGMDLFSVNRRGHGYDVYKKYHEAKPLMPGYKRRIKELEHLIASMEFDVKLTEKILKNPLFMFSSEFKVMQSEWMEHHSYANKAGVVRKSVASVQLMFNQTVREGTLLKMARNKDSIQTYYEILENVKLSEEKNLHHDAHLTELQEQADAILQKYHLFS